MLGASLVAGDGRLSKLACPWGATGEDRRDSDDTEDSIRDEGEWGRFGRPIEGESPTSLVTCDPSEGAGIAVEGSEFRSSVRGVGGERLSSVSDGVLSGAGDSVKRGKGVTLVGESDGCSGLASRVGWVEVSL